MVRFTRAEALNEADKMFARGDDRSSEYALLLHWGHGSIVQVQDTDSLTWLPLRELTFPIHGKFKVIVDIP